jgi:hypothetical protein
MKLKEIFDRMIRAGIERDPRGRENVERELGWLNEEYESMPEKEKELFDVERLTNPYDDSRILNGDPDTDIGSVMVGIDIEVGEILLADRLRSGGGRVDLVLAHHPEGRAMANFFRVMNMQVEMLHLAGVPVTAAEGLMDGRIKEVERRVMASNHDRTVDVARLLNVPLICVHTPSDNQVSAHLQELFDREKPGRVKDVRELLLGFPEYEKAAREGSGLKLVAGSESNRAGKVLVDMTGGTSGAKEIYEKLGQAEIGTIVGMHIPEDHRKEAKKHHINVLIAGHMSSDSLGLNLLLDSSLDSGVEVVPVSGFHRVPRN